MRRKRFLVVNVLHLIHPELILTEVTLVEKPRETRSVPQAIGTGTSITRDDKQNRGTIPMPTFAGKAVDHEFVDTGGHSADGAAIRQVP